MNRRQILIVPACENGRGGGHLCRCITLACDLRAIGREARLLLPEQSANTRGLFQSMNFASEWQITHGDLRNVCAKTVECIILDLFQTPEEELSRWKEIAPVIGIDEGGHWRDSFDFLIDILVPEKLGRPPANITSVPLLKFPQVPLQKKQSADEVLNVLVTFGQEDSAGLGHAVAHALSAKNNGGMEITLLRGKLSRKETEGLQNVRVLEAIPNLAERLGEYDLIITHYGITAYEALYAGTPVLLASPTAYHAKLARAAGFFELGTINEKLGAKYSSLLTHHSSFIKKLEKHCEALAARLNINDDASLAVLINGYSPQVNRRCPVCGGKASANSVSRFSDRTYRRCPGCGIIHMDRTCPPPVEYEKDYFFESYKRQYGKTYLEDFANIRKAGKRRVKIIKSLLHTAAESSDKESAASTQTLLDIGCAYGPFLAAASEEGFSPAGIDPTEDAVRYVQKELGFPAVQGFFPRSPLPAPRSPPYDAVTLWYVIEHFTDCAAVLSAVENIIKPAGGVLALSTPSFSGVSGRFSLRKFLLASPADHWTIWSPKICKRILSSYGFKVKKIVISGCHPERFPLFGKLAKSRKDALYWPLFAIGKIFRLGDTFEVYAIKNQ
ncbi:MAG: methyltransferase domain-containing protein [Treponema sp.]|jgi:spore coat polysaccharide biosynthesis predicted glycosyltransferase SpsG/2-polyprenyl-3-methyl-5-hydroxy-6-metoxy-1,4-benzoquinol methylase|nr:methyltransferase domain-containing protein [Treponema sp.]